MRFVLVVLIWVVIVGGLKLYTLQRDTAVSQARQSTPVNLNVDASFTLELTPTFSTEEDPFALQTGESSSKAIEIRLNGTSLELPVDELRRGGTVSLNDISGVLQGHNEIYVKASPPMNENSLAHGLRVKLLEGETMLLDQTVWNSGGALVSGSITFTYGSAGEDDHEHQ